MKKVRAVLIKKIGSLAVAALLLCAGSFFSLGQADAAEITVASGAGYKKPVSEVMAAFEKESSVHVNGVFGNIRMITNQAKQSGDISFVIGDKKFLKRMTGVVAFTNYQTMGKGILVLAYRKGIAPTRVEDIASDKVASIFMPQEKKAIYGIAGMEALQSYGYGDIFKEKVTQVATVPQVVSYLLTGEADVGFINLTEALANKQKLGGYLVVPQDKYKDVVIVSGQVVGFENSKEVKQFSDFLATDTAKQIFTQYGVQ